MTGPRVRIALLVLAVVLSGCTFGAGGAGLAPTAGTDGAAPAGNGATGDDPVTLENHSLSLDADTTFAQVERLVDENVTQPPVRVISPDDAAGAANPSFTFTPYRFAEYLDLDNVSAGGPSAAGLTDGMGRVFLVPGDGPQAALRQVLVHEFVHVVQFRSGMMPWSAPTEGNDTTDAAQVRLALTEGAAVYVTDIYTEQYLADANVTSQSAQMARLYENSNTGGRFLAARYHFGSQYVHHRLEDPSGLRSLYEDIPPTTEQLLHNDSAPGDPYQPLAVDAAGSDSWELTDPNDVDIMGELFVRVVLSGRLNQSRAAEAAAGWGVDRVIEYEQADRAAFAWVLRWDDAANATQFRAAMDEYVDRRSTGSDLTFRTATVGDETVVVFLGPSGFVDAANASGASEDVQVTVAG